MLVVKVFKKLHTLLKIHFRTCIQVQVKLRFLDPYNLRAATHFEL